MIKMNKKWAFLFYSICKSRTKKEAYYFNTLKQLEEFFTHVVSRVEGTILMGNNETIFWEVIVILQYGLKIKLKFNTMDDFINFYNNKLSYYIGEQVVTGLCIIQCAEGVW